MSIVNITEDDSVRTSTVSRGGRQAYRRFTVLMSAPGDGPIQARRANGIPRVGQPHPNDPFMFVEEVRCEPVGSSRVLFQVDVTYATPRATGSLSANDQSSPLDDPPEIRWGAILTTEAIDRDLDGKPIVNSADEGFDPPVTTEVSDPVLYITRHQASFDPDTIRIYHNAVNTDTFYGAQPGRARMIDIRADLIQDHQSSFTYWRVSYVIQFRFDLPEGVEPEKAWYKRVLDQGFRTKSENTITGYRQYDAILTEAGIPVARPVALNGSGLRLQDNVPPEWREFRVLKSASFGPLNLG